ncbi:50S ribosomal protein L2 [Patescibacteria group bacterium]|nr:50S ribosomal protein L2 [Patescibacteria group bacterium]
MKIYKPTTPSRRGMTGIDYSVLTKIEPEKTLTFALHRRKGRAADGRITVRHRGGGVKRLYRMVEFGQAKINNPGKVISLEYDPNRSSFIALIEHQDNSRSYIIAPQDLKVGDAVLCAEKTLLTPGNRIKLKNLPVGTAVHNIEVQDQRGGILVKSAGSSAQVLAQDEGFTLLKMPSTEIRKVKSECYASIGTVSNPEHRFVNLGKAGRARLMGRRPAVRGTAMNPCDHPHGGGEGRQPIGLKHPKTPWGKPALGYRTRKPKKASNKFIVQRRITKNK